MAKKRVLVFPCGTEIANEIISSLNHNKTFETVLASSVAGTYCDFWGKPVYLLPYVTSELFLDELNKIIESQQISFIFPAHDDAALVLSQLSDLLKAKLVGQNNQVTEIVRFKDRTYDFFYNFLPLPKIFENFDKVSTLPVFVKPKKGQGSFNTFLIKTKIDADRFLDQYNPQDFVIMEYLPGDEYTIDCFSETGKLVYYGARTREKTIKGISVVSFLVEDAFLNHQFEDYATTISTKMNMHGVWFYQMKKDRDGNLRLLEIGPRVAGTMMLNRARGVNLVEMALYQSAGFSISTSYNSQTNVGVGRALAPVYKHTYSYTALYVDFDDTLYLDESFINTDLMKLIFQCKNRHIPVHLITKNQKNNLNQVLEQYGLINVFSSIIQINPGEKKVAFMETGSMLIDDSFAERKEAIEAGFYALGVDAVNVLFERRDS